MRDLLLLFALAPSATAIGQQVVASGGGDHASGAARISYTIGEPVIETVAASGSTLTQGFNQPWADITTVVEEAVTDPGAVTVYPNPVRHILHIAVNGAADADRFILHDAAGRQVTDGRISSSLTELNMEPYASGSYYLRVLGTDDKTQRSFKISVTH